MCKLRRGVRTGAVALCAADARRASQQPPPDPQSYARGGPAGGGGGAPGGVPVPPCIQRLRGGGVQVALALEERAKSAALLRITADEVGVAVTRSAAGCAGELLELLGKALDARPGALSLLKGWSDRSKMLVVNGMTPEAVHAALQAWLDGERSRGGIKGYVPPPAAQGLMPPPPPRPPVAAAPGGG